MKKIFTIIILAAVIAMPQQLRKVVTSSYNSLSSVSFIDDNTGWACGYGEIIYKTTDGGITWNVQYEDTASGAKTLYEAQFFNANTGYVAGGGSNEAILLKTTDGGSTWNPISFPAAYQITSISFTSEQTGWALTMASDSSRIWMTTDGGANWNSVLFHGTGDLEDIQMRSSGRGMCVGGGVGKLDLYYTADGITWTKATPPQLGGFSYTRTDAHAVYMLDDNNIYTCGWGSYVGAQPSIFLKSTDGGVNWTYLTQAAENRIYQNMNAIYFKDALNGVAFGGGIYEGSICARTTDGGVNWVPLPTGMGFTIQAAYGAGDKLWVAGNAGAIAYSSDFGTSWQVLTPILGSTLYELKVKGNNIFAAGYGGIFFRSTDKGVTWKTGFAASGRVCPTINALSFVDDLTGFAARNNKLVTKTTDGGLTWEKIMQDSSATGMINQGIWFNDVNNGYAVGRTGSNADVIYKTVDGGLNWSAKNLVVNDNMNDVAFFDADHGVAVAADSKIAYTTDAGANWSVAAITGMPAELDIVDVAYSSSSNVVAVGEKCIVVSVDGGANWTYKEVSPDFTKTLQGVGFKDENEGWAVGDKFILHTINAGKDWENISDTLVTGLTSLYSVDVDNEGYAWFAGGSEVFTYSPFVSVQDNNIPLAFELLQNYPNPFNPVTNIKYNVPSESKVSIKVYDILGNLVKSLVDGTKQAGEYNLSFDAGNLSSGIYFCTMNVEGKSVTRKMTLMK